MKNLIIDCFAGGGGAIVFDDAAEWLQKKAS